MTREDSRNKMVEENLRLVGALARQYQGQGLSYDDLVSEGYLGLIKAAEKYDASRGTTFASFASAHIRKTMEKALGKETAQQQAVAAQRGGVRSLDAPFNGRSTMSLLSVLADGNVPEADERIFKGSTERAVEKALNILEGREQQVVAAYFGIEQERQTMAEIAEDMGLKRERVRQIRDRAVRRLRKEYRHQMSELRP